MFIRKKKYYLIIESIKDINLNNIKKRNKFTIIYRNKKELDKKEDLKIFRKYCKLKSIDFFIANNLNLATYLNSDGIYLSSYNRSFRALSQQKTSFHIIGSAHNLKEVYQKKKQGCKYILFSRLFRVSYKPHMQTLGVIKFNNFFKSVYKGIIPLGGINLSNINKLKMVRAEGLALMTEIKKKPAISSRLF